MATFVVMKPDRAARAGTDDAILVRDGFAYIAFFVPVIWLVWHRLWIETVLALAVTLGLAALGNVAGFGVAAPLLSLLVSIYAGLEGAVLRIAALRRRGWHEFGVVEADNQEDAVTRWLIETVPLSETEFERPDLPPPASGIMRKVDHGPALGFLLNPGKS
jgi:hypothetical protein